MTCMNSYYLCHIHFIVSDVPQLCRVTSITNIYYCMSLPPETFFGIVFILEPIVQKVHKNMFIIHVVCHMHKKHTMYGD